jgi:predicted ester cyclase
LRPWSDVAEGAAGNTGDVSKTVDAARVARAALENVCSGNLDDVACHYHPEFVDHVNGSTFHGHEGVRKSVAFYETLLDDLQFAVNDQVTEGDKVASRFTMTGSREGRKIELHGIVISRLEDGLIIEDFAVSDSLELMRQLGPRRLLTLVLKDWRALLSHR